MSVRGLWRLWALALAVVVLGWIALQGALSSREVQEAGAVRPAIRLPDVAPPPRPVDPTPALQTLSQSNFWGPRTPRPASGASGTDEAEPVPPKWSVTGYYERAGIRHVIVSFEQQVRPSQQLKVADKLPDGSRIEQIQPDRVRVRMARTDPPEEGASSPKSEWIPITPGLSKRAAGNSR